ncbi:MAG: MFS transporter [Parachlamydiales bacterium]|nr:MFS transporter [Parachlamydiales bacterium]
MFTRKNNILIVLIGNLLYHFDRALFDLLIPFLVPVFFPQQDPVYALIYLYAIGPLSLFIKPLGALIFGHFGDRLGTKKILSITLLGMAIHTGMMGFLPTYAQAGLFSPLLLALTRLMISFFSSGETTGGAITLFENTSPAKRNLISSLYDASGVLGILIASFSVWILHSTLDFWRILFWSGSIIGAIGWYLRKSSLEEPSRTQKTLPPAQVLWKYRTSIVKIMLLAGFSYANYYLTTNFMNGFLHIISSITKEKAIGLNSALLAFDLLLLPLFGILSLKIRKETLMILSILGIIFCGCPLFFLLKDTTLFKASFLRILLMVFGVILAAPYHAWVYEKTPENHRYLLGAFSTAMGGRIGSFILPMGLWLYHKTNLTAAPIFPLIVLGFFSLIAIGQKESIKAKQPLLDYPEP